MSTEETFKAFDSYDFENDARFQAGDSFHFEEFIFHSGLPSLLNNQTGKSEDERHAMIQKAKWFYYTKFVTSFDYNEYQQWCKNVKCNNTNTSDNKIDSTENSSTQEPDQTPPRLTFQEIVEKIEKGEEIPGIKQIPNKLNEAAPSEAKLAARPKPWEVNRAPEQDNKAHTEIQQ